jgi:predicted CXXCH cytochrome family protein
VPDGYCLGCHANLAAHAIPPASGYSDVTRFPDGHPPFPSRTDPGCLHFNHSSHLRPEGVRAPGRTPVRLACQDCHRPDDAGRYMRPVRYAEHCAGCHPLSVRLAGRADDPSVARSMEYFAAEPAPHQAAPAVRAALRERLLDWLRECPVLPGDDAAPAAGLLGATTPDAAEAVWQRAGRVLTDGERHATAQKQLTHLEGLLFDRPGGCRLCHLGGPEGDLEQGAVTRPAYEPTALVDRWRSHARFRHAAHRMLDCTECHAAATSRRAADVLLPGLDACARCHNARAGGRTDCAGCHSYHLAAPEDRHGQPRVK